MYINNCVHLSINYCNKKHDFFFVSGFCQVAKQFAEKSTKDILDVSPFWDLKVFSPASKASIEVENLTERKPVHGVKEFVCLSVRKQNLLLQ